MKIHHILLTTASLATAQFPAWHPLTQDSERGPCPALNSLANHNFIPHSGKNLSVPLLVEALGVALNVSTEMATTVAKAGLRTSSNPESGTFSLADLRKHNIIEHDGSLSRKDFSEDGDNFSFDREIFEQFLGYLGEGEGITIQAAAAARWNRIKSSRAQNPTFTYSASNRFNSYLETAIYLELFRDPKSQTSSLPFVKIFFEQERLPFNEGWRPNNVIDGFSLMQDVLALSLYTTEETPDFGSEGLGYRFHGVSVMGSG